MEILRPLQATSSGESGVLTVLVHRTVPKAEKAVFLERLNGLLRDFGRFPGTSGSMVFQRETGAGVEFSILQKFDGESAHEAWLQSPEFIRWREAVAPPEPEPGHVHRYSGMEAFFVSAGAPDAPPRWKMAVLLLLAVYPMSLAISHWFAPALAHVSLFTGSLITSVSMVVLMTYVVVPILTKLFQWWLQPSSGSRQGNGSS